MQTGSRGSVFTKEVRHLGRGELFWFFCCFFFLTRSVWIYFSQYEKKILEGSTVPTKRLLNGWEGGVPRRCGAGFCRWPPSCHCQHSARRERICCITHCLHQVHGGTLQINFISRYFWTSASNQVDKEHL